MRGPARILTDADAAEIRDWFERIEAARKVVRDMPTAADMARRMGVSRQTIYTIAKGYSYKLRTVRNTQVANDSPEGVDCPANRYLSAP